MDDDRDQDSVKRTAGIKKYDNNLGIGENEDIFLQAKVKYFDLITSNAITAGRIIDPTSDTSQKSSSSERCFRKGGGLVENPERAC